MATTLRDVLKKIKEIIDEEGEEVLDLPVLTIHSASGMPSALYGPYLSKLDKDTADMTYRDADEPFIKFVGDH